MYQVADPMRSEMGIGYLMGGRKMVAMVAKWPKNDTKTAIVVPHFEGLPVVETRISNFFSEISSNYLAE